MPAIVMNAALCRAAIPGHCSQQRSIQRNPSLKHSFYGIIQIAGQLFSLAYRRLHII